MNVIVKETGLTQTEAAYQTLHDDIIAGVREPGERLKIERLKALYGIGPTPIREALQRLSADGLVLAAGNRGFSVAPLEATELRDLNDARTALEVQAVGLAMARGDAEWEAVIVGAAHRLRKIDEELKSGAGSMDDWSRANEAFHLAIVSACGSRWLLRLRRILNDQYERYRRASVQLRPQDRDLAFEHQGIMNAVLDRDTRNAGKLTADHFNETTRVLVDELGG